MEILLLGIYSFFVWLIFIKFKWLPWNIDFAGHRRHHPDRRADGDDPHAQRRRAVVERRARLSSTRCRSSRRSAGRVIEVPVEEGNRPVKKGDVLFRIDPTPYQLEVNTLEAQLANAQRAAARARGVAEGRAGQDRRNARRDRAGRRRGPPRSTREPRPRAQARRAVPRARRHRRRHRFDLEQAETNLAELTGNSTRRAAPRRRRAPARRRRSRRREQVQQKLGAQVERRIRAGRADPRAAREREVGSRPDDHALALRLLRDQPAAAPGRLRRRPAGRRR